MSKMSIGKIERKIEKAKRFLAFYTNSCSLYWALGKAANNEKDVEIRKAIYNLEIKLEDWKVRDKVCVCCKVAWSTELCDKCKAGFAEIERLVDSIGGEPL